MSGDFGIGFIGTGAITEAIVTGLLHAETTPPILLSPRSAHRAKRLAATYPTLGEARSNQDVLDRSAIIILAFLPKDCEEILSGLRFRHDHLCISLLAGVPLARVRALVAPADSCVRVTPTPAVADRRGPITVCPPDRAVIRLFEPLGSVIEARNEREFDALLACSAAMASYFRLLEANADFLKAHDIASRQADLYVGSLFAALGQTALAKSTVGFDELAIDHATPGGLNEQLARELAEGGVFAAHRRGLEHIFQRVTASAS